VNAITATGLRRSYGDTEVLKGVDLNVRRGTVFSLLGANGAGKTTTLLTLAGALTPIHGEIYFDGERIDRWPAPRIARRGMASIPDDRGLFPKLTVRENLRLANRHRRRAPDALQLFPELQSRLDTLAGLLSGGQQQMLAIARALAGEPRLLLIDELSFGLAPIAVQRLLPTVRAVADETGAGVLLVEQHVHLGLAIAERAYVLSHGSIALQGTADELRDDTTLLRESYLGADERTTA